MAHTAGDSMAVLANLVPGRHRGSSCVCPGAASRVIVPESLSGRRPFTNSRAWLMGDQKLHNGRRGDVPSAWVPTILGMTLQCRKWWHNGEDGCTGSEGTNVMEEMRPAGLTSWRRPGRARSRWSYPFRGCLVLFRGDRHGRGTGLDGTVSWNDTDLPAQRRGWSHSAGWSINAGI
jgi:hypothetical protein